MKRVDGQYLLDAEVTAMFTDFQMCQSACNFIVEKLDETVKVSTPQLFHSQQRIENLRRQASLTAVSNARQKATEITHFLHMGIGRPISIREEAINEWEGSNDITYTPDITVSMQQRVARATVYVSVKCMAIFELKSKGKSKEAKKE